MPLNAIASAREILTGLHDVMAKRGSAQAKLDHVVDLIAAAMESEVCSIYLLRDKALELFATHGLRRGARPEPGGSGIASIVRISSRNGRREFPQFCRRADHPA